MMMSKNNRRKASRGVVLLVILGLLAMFAVVVLAFVLITSTGRREARSLQRVDEYAPTPQEELQQAARQVFRGTTSGGPLREHSLMEDMLGTGIVLGNMAAGVTLLDSPANPNPVAPAVCRAICNGQLIEFTAAYEQRDTVNNVAVYFLRRLPSS